MKTLWHNVRIWWQPPRSVRDRPAHRQVSFLELFYDLVYVVLVSELTHGLAEHVSLLGVAQFAFLFVIVWWAWLNGTMYHELHGNDDIRSRVFTFLQMFCVAAMAIFAHAAFGSTATGFALSYAAFQLILLYLWSRTGVYDPAHRAPSRPYVVAFCITTLLFAASALIASAARFYLWYVAIGVSIMLPLISLLLGRNDPARRAQSALTFTPTSAVVERLDLLTIIVLGEVIVAVVHGVAGHQQLSVEVGLIGLLGMVIAIGLWWLYFDFVSLRLPRPGIRWMLLWMYTHLPITAGIAVAGAAVLNVIEGADTFVAAEVRWLLVGAITTVLLGLVILIQTLRSAPHFRPAYRKGQAAMLAAALLILALGFSSLQMRLLLAAIIVLMLTPIYFGLLFWVRAMQQQQ